TAAAAVTKPIGTAIVPVNASDVYDTGISTLPCNDATHAVGADASGKLVCNASLSDERLKTAAPMQDALDDVRRLTPIRFTWTDPSRPGADDRSHLGFT